MKKDKITRTIYNLSLIKLVLGILLLKILTTGPGNSLFATVYPKDSRPVPSPKPKRLDTPQGEVRTKKLSSISRKRGSFEARLRRGSQTRSEAKLKISTCRVVPSQDQTTFLLEIKDKDGKSKVTSEASTLKDTLNLAANYRSKNECRMFEKPICKVKEVKNGSESPHYLLKFGDHTIGEEKYSNQSEAQASIQKLLKVGVCSSESARNDRGQSTNTRAKHQRQLGKPLPATAVTSDRRKPRTAAAYAPPKRLDFDAATVD